MEGANEATQCPAGTFSDKNGVGTLEECNDCPAGSYCEDQICSGSCEYVKYISREIDTSNKYICIPSMIILVIHSVVMLTPSTA